MRKFKEIIVAIFVVPMVILAWLFVCMANILDDTAICIDEGSTKFGKLLVKWLKL